jgi:predicted metalloprotease with PDZ domain
MNHFAGLDLIEINNSTNTKSIGLNYSTVGQDIFVTSLTKGRSAYDNGINVGDELISINNYRLYSHNINALIGLNKVGDSATFLINRKGIVKTIELDIRKDNRVNYKYEYLEGSTKQQERVYETWLGY